MSHEAAEKFIQKYDGQDVHPLMVSLFHDCLLRNLKSASTKCYMERISYLMSYLYSRGLDINDLTKQVLQEYILSLRGKVSVATINGRLRIFKLWFRYLKTEELWAKQNPMKGIRQLKEPRKVKPVIGPEDMTKMLRSLKKKNFFDNRNRLALLLHWSLMLRSGEIRHLKISDIDIPRRTAIVDGKTGARALPLSVKVLKMISSFLIKWRKGIPGDTLICMSDGQPITPRRYNALITNIAQNAGVKTTPHGLRRSAATHYAKLPGASLEMLRILLGHSSLAVTQIYLSISISDMVESYKTLAPDNAIRY